MELRASLIQKPRSVAAGPFRIGKRKAGQSSAHAWPTGFRRSNSDAGDHLLRPNSARGVRPAPVRLNGKEIQFITDFQGVAAGHVHQRS